MKTLNRYWRIVGTGFSFALFGIGGFLIGAIFLLINPLPFSDDRKRYLIRRIISKTCQAYIRIMRGLRLLTYSFDTSTPIPKGTLIIANHPTLLDAVYILAHHDNLCCIMKSALWRHPATSRTAKLAGYIPNDSETFLEQAQEKLQNGENLLIFPEGSRNKNDENHKFRRGAATLALMAKCQITPILITCEPRTLQKGEKWYQVPPTKPHFAFKVLPDINPLDHIPTDKPRTVQYRRLTRYLENYYDEIFSNRPSNT